jgi:hypothetical protein
MKRDPMTRRTVVVTALVLAVGLWYAFPIWETQPDVVFDSAIGQAHPTLTHGSGAPSSPSIIVKN